MRDLVQEARSASLARLLQESVWVRRLATRLVRDPEAVDDVVQDAWLAALQAKPREGDSLRAWFGGVVRNLARRRHRQESSRRYHEIEAAAPTPGTGANGRAELERVRLQRTLADGLIELEEPYRSAVVLRFFDDLSHREIARRQEISEPAARQRVSRGLAKLRARLRREFGDTGALHSVLLAFHGGLSEGAPVAGAPTTWTSTAGSFQDLGTTGVLMMGIKTAAGIVVFLLLAAGLWTLVPVGNEPRVPEANQDSTVAELPSRPSRRAAAMEPQAQPRTEGLGRDVESRTPVLSAEPSTPPRTPAQPASEAVVPVELSRLRGFLLSAEGLPITVRAQVSAHLDEGESDPLILDTLCRSDGSFTFEELPVGRLLKLVGRAEGFVEKEQALDLELLPGSELRHDLTLEQGALVTGVVVDSSTGEPVSGARVWADAYRYDAEGYQPRAIADEFGCFRLQGVEFQPYETEEGVNSAFFRLRAEAEGYTSNPLILQGHTWNGAGPYEIELSVTPSTCTLSGVVFSRTLDGPPSDALVFLISAGNWSVAQTDEGGRFELTDLAPGPYRLLCRRGELARPEGHQSVLHAGELEAGRSTTCELELRSGEKTLRGRVLDPAGQPVPDIEVELSLQLSFGGLGIALDSSQSSTNELGEFSFVGLPPGMCDLKVDKRGMATLPRRHQIDLAPSGARGESSSGSEYDFVLGPAISLAGRIHGSDPLPPGLSARVVSVRDTSEVIVGRIEGDGSFRIEGLLEGYHELSILRGERVLSTELVGPFTDENLHIRIE